VVGTLHRQTVHLREDHVTRVRVATLGTVDVPAPTGRTRKARCNTSVFVPLDNIQSPHFPETRD
jgi:hypothetical protein